MMIDKSLRTNDIMGASPKSYRGSIDSLDEQIQARKIAGIKNYYSNIQAISETERYLENGSRGRKRRFYLPQNEIQRSNIFYAPSDEFYPQLNESSKLEYNRSLQTDDIQGSKPGTFTNPSLKNLFRGKQIKSYQQWLDSNSKIKQFETAETQPAQRQSERQSEKTEQEINILKERLNQLQSQITQGIPNNSSQQIMTAQNILSPKQYQQQSYEINNYSQDNKSIWGQMLDGKKVDTSNVIKFGRGFKQLGYIYKNY